MNNFKVSIIVPIYNSSQYLSKCINSIIKQTYENIEIILVNDGSTDNSLGICEEYSKLDDRIVVLDKENGGVSSARNYGIDVSTGDYIGFVDSDDYISLDMYESLVNAVIEFDADIVECGYYLIDSDKNLKAEFPMKSEIVKGNYNCSYKYLSKNNTTNYNVNKLYKNSIFKKLRYKNYKFSEDYYVNSIAFYNCSKKITINGCYYYYCKNENSVTKKPFSIDKFHIIESGIDVYYFYERRLKKLCPLIAVYIVTNVFSIYFDMFFLKLKDKSIYKEYLKKTFNNYYKVAVSYKNINLKLKIILLFFKFSATLTCFLYFLIKKIKK